MYETDLFTDVIAAQPPVGKTSLDPQERRERQNIRRHRDIGILGFFRKLADRTAQIDNPEVPLVVDDIEPGLLEKRAHRCGIVGRIAEWRNPLVIGDADHQRTL